MRRLGKIFGVALLSGFMAGCSNDNEEPQTPDQKTEVQKAAGDCCSTDFEEVSQKLRDIGKMEANTGYQIVLPGDRGFVSFMGLTDHNGQRVTLDYMEDQFRGKRLALYFGFPDCTVYCPPSTSAIMTTLERVNDPEIVPIFIASRTDPNTGQPYTHERMQHWLNSFASLRTNAIALTGSVSDLSRIYTKMHVVDEHGNHVPYWGLVNEKGEFLGGGKAITGPYQENGRAVFRPAPDLLEEAYKQKFRSNNTVEPEQPDLGR